MVFRRLGILLCAVALHAQDVRLQVLETSGLRGHILPEDTFTLQPVNQGWAKLATLIHGLKAANPNTLLVDCGDATQGEPINYVWSHLRNDAPEPSMAILNLLGCSAMVIGHREFEAAAGQFRLMQGQARFPWLAANVVAAATGKPAFTSYVKVDVAGVSVAILGLTAPVGPRLAQAGALEGLRILDPVATARTLVPMLREKDKVDVVLVALHGGSGSLPPGAPEANPQRELAQVPGIDLLLAGQGREPLAQEQQGAPLLQAGLNGQALGVADLLLRKEKGRWVVVSRQTRLVQPTAETAADPEVLEATAPLRALTDSYLNTFATTLGVELDGRWCRMENTAVMRLLHLAARRGSGAQITAMSPPGAHVFIPKGPTSVRQFYALVPKDWHMARIQVTGAQLRAYLEHAARCFNLSHQVELFNKAIPGGAFDTLDGCTYTLDLNRPAGARVTELKVDGHEVKDDQHFTLGLTSQRLAGGGGYLEAMGWHGKAEFVSPELLRNQLLEMVLAKGTLDFSVPSNWRTVPSLDRERVLAQQP